LETLLKFCSFIDRMNERIGRAASWLTLLAVVVCTVNAVVRYSINMSSNAWLEMQWYLNSGMFLLVAAYALKINAHVRIDVIAGRLSPRAQACIDIFGGLFFLLPVSLIIAWYSWPALVSSWNINEMSSDHGGLIRWPMRFLIPVAFVLLALQGVSEIIKRCAFLAGRGPNPAAHLADPKREAA
jgi:TRAP-type mannitol/chloroaromatic compound transport system permease small subunit